MGFTQEAKEKLQQHYGCDDLDVPLGNHLLLLGSDMGFFTDLGHSRHRDVFGVVWDRSIDKDIGRVENCVLSGAHALRLYVPRPVRWAVLCRYCREDRPLSPSFSCLPNGVFPVRTGLDAAGNGQLARGPSTIIRNLSASCSRRLPTTR